MNDFGIGVLDGDGQRTRDGAAAEAGRGSPQPASHAGRWPGRRARVVSLLVIGDLLALASALFLGGFAIGALGLLAGAPEPDLVHTFLMATPLFLVLGVGTGLYDCHGRMPFERFRSRAYAIALFYAGGVPIAAVAPALLPSLLVFVPVAAFATLLLGWWSETALRHVLVRRGMWNAPVAVIGTGPASQALAARLKARPDFGLDPVALVSVLDAASMRSSARTWRIEGAVVPQAVMARIVAAGAFGSLGFTRVTVVPDAPPAPATIVRTRRLGDTIGIDLRREAATAPQRWVKRGIDLAVAAPLLVLSAPLIVVLALAIKLLSPGSAFYAQPRVGRAGSRVQVSKLRTMYPDAERRLQHHLAVDQQARAEWERYVKLSNDPRVLPVVGSFIRRASLDELPQLWNIVCGDMSLVGPRPFPPYHLSRFDAPFQALRSSVTPGLTGLWQVTSRSDGDLATQKEQDSEYIRNWSLLLDLYILFQTLPAVLFAKGAR